MSLKKALLGIQKQIQDESFKFTTNAKGHHNHKYADIEQVLKLFLPIFSEAGILLTQKHQVNELGQFILVTELCHVESNETIQAQWLLGNNDDPQKLGAATTYGRRYSLKSLLNLQESDDADQVKAPTPIKRSNEAAEIALDINALISTKKLSKEKVQEITGLSGTNGQSADRLRKALEVLKNYTEQKVS